MQLPAEQLNIYRGTSSQKYTENTEIKKWKIKTKKYISCPSLTVRALWQWSKFMASVQRCKNGTHSRQIQKKKAYGDISIRSMCLHHLHIYTPSTDKCELLHTRQRTLDLKQKKKRKKKNPGRWNALSDPPRAEQASTNDGDVVHFKSKYKLYIHSNFPLVKSLMLPW